MGEPSWFGVSYKYPLMRERNPSLRLFQLRNNMGNYGNILIQAGEKHGFKVVETEQNYQIYGSWQEIGQSHIYISKCCEQTEFDRFLQISIDFHTRK